MTRNIEMNKQHELVAAFAGLEQLQRGHDGQQRRPGPTPLIDE